MDKTVYTTFCNLVGTHLPTEQAYARFGQINLITSSAILLVLSLFCRELMLIVGKGFSESSAAVFVILSIAKALTAPMIYLNLALLTAYQRTDLTVLYYCAGGALALGIYWFVASTGMIGIALGFTTLQIMLFVLSTIMVKFSLGNFVSKRGYATVILASCFAGACFILVPEISVIGVLVKLGVLVLFGALVFGLRLLSPSEIRSLLKSIIRPSQRPVEEAINV